MTLRSERSIPYPVEGYSMGEVQASFSAESLNSHDDDNDNKKPAFFQNPLMLPNRVMSPLTAPSDNQDSALEDSYCSDDSNHHDNQVIKVMVLPR
jgi:hypothetical protein